MGKNRDHLDKRVQERTTQLEQLNRELANTNEALLAEIANCKKAEATLIETDQKLRNIIEHSTNLFYMHGTDHVFTYTSPQSRHFFDCEPEEAMGRWTELITDNPLNRAAIEATQRAIDTGERQPSYMVECIGRKGRIVWVEVNESPIVVEGRTVAIVGSLTDITERKRMEAELGHFASFPLLNPTPIIEMDSDGKVTFCNSAAEKMLGKTTCLDSSNPFIPGDLPDLLRDLQQKKVSQYRRTVEVGDQVFDEMIYLAPQFNSMRIFAMDITERRRLEEDRSRLAAIVENSDDAIFAKTLDGIIVDWNKGAEKLYGYTASEMKGRHVSTLVPADRTDEVPQILEKIGRGENVENIETIRVAKDGRQIPVLLAISPIKDTSGKITGASTIAHDITERKRTEQALRESEERFRVIFEQAAVGIGEVSPDRRWQRVNRKLCEIVGYTEEELKSLPTKEIDHPDDLETSMKQFQLLLDGKLSNYFLEKRYIRKDGSTVWVNLTNSAVFDASGNLKFAVGVLEDITGRKRAEQALQESEERLRLAIDATGLGTFDFYPQTGTMIWSALTKHHFGLPPDAHVDFGVFLAGLHPDDREQVDGIIQDLLNPVSGSEYSTEYRTIGLQDGKERWIAARGRMFYDETGRAVRFVGTTLDITERKRAEEEIETLTNNLNERAFELAAANLELEAFNYTVAHDLRKPLTVINGYCQALRELCGNRLDAHCREYLQEAYDGTLRMNLLIDALLNFSRLAHVELRRETVDLSGMAQLVAAELRLAEPGRRVTFLIADGVSADGDADLLRVVLVNLLGNAWKYTGTRDEGIIEFGTTEVDGKPAWFVRDNGAGFAMADADKLFMPFQRLPGAEEFKGHGIGLATVERIISRHGGKIWAEGEPGKGATFYFTLSE